MRRLDAALSNAPLKICDKAKRHSGSRTKSAKEILAAKKESTQRDFPGLTRPSSPVTNPRGVRRLDAALSNAPLKICDKAKRHSGSRTKSAKEILAAKKESTQRDIPGLTRPSSPAYETVGLLTVGESVAVRVEVLEAYETVGLLTIMRWLSRGVEVLEAYETVGLLTIARAQIITIKVLEAYETVGLLTVGESVAVRVEVLEAYETVGLLTN